MSSTDRLFSVARHVGRGCPHGVMVKAMDCGIVVSEFTPVTLLRSLSGKYPWEGYESSQLWVKKYHYCSSRRIALALNNLQRLICL